MQLQGISIVPYGTKLNFALMIFLPIFDSYGIFGKYQLITMTKKHIISDVDNLLTTENGIGNRPIGLSALKYNVEGNSDC